MSGDRSLAEALSTILGEPESSVAVLNHLQMTE